MHASRAQRSVMFDCVVTTKDVHPLLNSFTELATMKLKIIIRYAHAVYRFGYLCIRYFTFSSTFVTGEKSCERLITNRNIKHPAALFQ